MTRDVPVEFTFRNRLDRSVTLKASPGDKVSQVLARYHIPAASVLVLCDQVPVPDTHRLEGGRGYVASLIEGYDIDVVRQCYVTDDPPPAAAYVKRRLSFGTNGRLRMEQVALGMGDIVDLVEDTVEQTVSHYNLIPPRARVLVGLSGGVDSSALLLALASLRLRRGDFDIVAATFEDYDAPRSGVFDRARLLAQECGAQHAVVPAELARSIFQTSLPLAGVLLSLMETDDAHQTMYVDHHVTRRTLEVFSERAGGGPIALGLHTTDLLASLLNGQAVGYSVGSLPRRSLPNAEYIFPLAFIQKRELHLYYLAKTGRMAIHSPPNQWELNPQDRNYYYYFADRLQDIWPGLEMWFFSGHAHDIAGRSDPAYAICVNCGGAVQTQDIGWQAGQLCDICAVLDRHHLIDRDRSAQLGAEEDA